MKVLATHLRADGRREKFLVDNWPDNPPVGQGSFRTRTLFTGVTNGTERNDLIGGNYANPDEKLPATWGYQNVGEVVEVGEGVEDVGVGDIVYLSADHVDGTVFKTEWKLYVKLPKVVDPREAALFGMASVAMRTCRHADIRIGEKVLVVGAGFIGQMAAQIAAAMGAWVTIVDVDDERLALAREIGSVDQALNCAGEKWKASVQPGSFHVVIDVAGVPGMEDAMIEALVQRGRLMIIAGRFRVDYTFNTGQGRELHLLQNSHFDRDDLELLCRCVEKGRVRISPLLREVVPVRDARRVYDTLRDEPGKLLGTVFDWSEA